MADDCEMAADHGPTSTNELTVVTIVLQQMTLMEARLSARLDRSDASATGRWVSHEAEHADIDKALRGLVRRLDDHLRKEERDELVFDARMGPAKRAAQLLAREWRTVTIVVLVLADFIARARAALGV